jgi:FkbM family methyltransferase
MLIPFSECVRILKDHNISVKGILHIGAHECEELKDYVSEGVSPGKIDWIEANNVIVERMKSRGVPNIHNFAVDSEEGEAEFFVTNNGQSSSLLKFGTHEQSYPWCKVTEVQKVQKKRLDTFFSEHPEINVSERNFWNLDIQGSELNALKSASDHLNFVDAIYSEVNIQYVYQNCGLLQEMDIFLESKGFKRVKTSMTDAGWGDALWVRTK